MRNTTVPRTTFSVPVLLAVLVIALGVVAAAGAKPPPMNRSYEITFIMPPVGDDPQEIVTDCITFTEHELCIAGLGECAPWYFHLVVDEKRPAFKSVFQYVDEDGTSVELHVRGLTERRGNPRSSIAGVAAAAVQVEGVREVINFGFSGREVADCRVFEPPSE